MVIATKVCGRTGDGPNDGGLGRKHIMAAVEGSLRRLGTDYVDLYQCHTWDPTTPLEESLSTFDALVRSGKVRFLGTSNLPAWRLQKEIEVSRRYGWESFVCLQPLYNLLDRGLDHLGLMEVCRNEGIGVIPWSPLAGGWLSGKYRRSMNAPPSGTRIDNAGRPGNFYGYAKWDTYAIERTWTIIDTLLMVATEVGKSPAQVALRWLLQREGVTAPIIGARKLEQLEDNLGAVGWSLSDEHLERLTLVSEVRLASRVEG
jgi:aryl-alcohol dehydrogenase-like predicted oxidoreductase